MLPALENVPRSPSEWWSWAFDHRDSHDRIRAAILKTNNVNLTDYQIEPIDPNNLSQFLENNSNLHDDMNATLGLQSTNLQDADLSDERQLIAWIKSHYQEHYDAENKAGV